MYSVCVVTLIRLILSTRLKFDDVTYNYARISIFTVLEPLLGIIIACLPLSRPAIKKVICYVKNTPPETPNVLSSTMARLRLKRSKGSAFQRFDNSLLFTDLENNRTQNNITGPSSESEYSLKDFGQGAATRIPPQSSVIIARD